MKNYLTILTWLLIALSNLQAQDRATKKLDSLLRVRADSMKSVKLDTLVRRFQMQDSVYLSQLERLDSSINRAQASIDSLTRLKLPTDRYKRKLDSMQSILAQKLDIRKYSDSVNYALVGTQQKVTKLTDSLQLAVNSRIISLQEKLASKLTLGDSLGVARLLPQLKSPSVLSSDPIPNVSVPTIPDLNSSDFNLKQPDLNLPGVNISKPDLPTQVVSEKIKDVSTAAEDIQRMPKQNLDNIDGLQEIKQQVARVQEITEKVDLYKADINEIRDGNLKQVENISKELERLAVEHTDIQAIHQEQQQFIKQKNMLEQYKNMVTQLDSGHVAEKVKDIAKENMPDYFANHQDKLKAGIAQLDKLKSKYGSFADSRYLPKRAPNPMRQLSFRERIIPALSFQFFKASATSTDITTSISYKLSGRFRPGISAFWRLSASFRDPFVEYKEVHGYRIFNDLRVWAEFFLRSETEWIKFSEVSLKQYKFQADLNKNLTWFRLNMGLHRTYPISKRFNGNAQLLYNVLDLKRFPQNRNSIVRIGFEYKFRKTNHRRKFKLN